MAESYLQSISLTPGGVAEQAAVRKQDKYVELAKSYLFQPLSFETMGPINISGQSFITELGRRICEVSGEKRETAFLYQRVSVAIQRFKCVAFRGCFASSADLDS